MSLIKKVMLQASETVASHEEEVSFLDVAGAYINAGAIIAAKKLGKLQAAQELTNALMLATGGDRELIEECLKRSFEAHAMQQAGPAAMLARGAVHKNNEVN